MGVYHSLHGLLNYLGCSHLRDIRGIDDDDLGSAIWIALGAVPERDVTRCCEIVRRYLDRLGDSDLREMRDASGNDVRRFVGELTEDPVPAIFVFQALGHLKIRALPTVGASLLLQRLELVSAIEVAYFTDGFPAVQEEARKTLERHPIGTALMAEWWGLFHCPESCPMCPARTSCQFSVKEALGEQY